MVSLLNISTDFIANLVTYTLSGNNEVRPPIALQCVKYMVWAWRDHPHGTSNVLTLGKYMVRVGIRLRYGSVLIYILGSLTATDHGWRRLLHALKRGLPWRGRSITTLIHVLGIWYELVYGTSWYRVRVGKNVGYEFVLGTCRLAFDSEYNKLFQLTCMDWSMEMLLCTWGRAFPWSRNDNS